MTTDIKDPRNAHAILRRVKSRSGAAGIYPANDLMPRYNRQDRWGGSPLDFVELGVADATGGDADADLSLPRLRCREGPHLQRTLPPSMR